MKGFTETPRDIIEYLRDADSPNPASCFEGLENSTGELLFACESISNFIKSHGKKIIKGLVSGKFNEEGLEVLFCNKFEHYAEMVRCIRNCSTKKQQLELVDLPDPNGYVSIAIATATKYQEVQLKLVRKNK